MEEIEEKIVKEYDKAVDDLFIECNDNPDINYHEWTLKFHRKFYSSWIYSI